LEVIIFVEVLGTVEIVQGVQSVEGGKIVDRSPLTVIRKAPKSREHSPPEAGKSVEQGAGDRSREATETGSHLL
jgi:hypothetical protein